MKKLTVLIGMMMLQLSAFSQDHIITRDKEDLLVRVLKEEKKDIAYYDWNDPSKAIKHISSREVKKINYELPPQGTDLIILRIDSLTGRDLFSDILSYLIQDGYEIERFYKDDLKATTKFKENHRITVEVEGNEAHFIGNGKKDKEVEFIPAPETGTKATIQLADPSKSDVEKEFPGEKRARWGGTAFKEIDQVCRNYLMKHHGSLYYGME